MSWAHTRTRSYIIFLNINYEQSQVWVQTYRSSSSLFSSRADSTESSPLFLSLSRNLFLSFITPGRSSRMYLMSARSWCMLVFDRSILTVSWVSIDKSIFTEEISISSKDIDTRLTKAWTANDRLSIIWKSDLTDKMKRSFFQAVVVSILLYGCTTWTLTKRLKKKLDGNYTRMLRAILNKSWRQHRSRPPASCHEIYTS